MKSSSKEVIESIIEIVETSLTNYLQGGCEYLSKIEYTGNEFPKVFIFEQNAGQIQQQANSCSITFRFMDVAESLNNKQRKDYEIKSDMTQAASLLIDYLQRDGVLVVDTDTSFEPVYITGGDGLSGIELTINFPIMKPCVVAGLGGGFPYIFPFSLS